MWTKEKTAELLELYKTEKDLSELTVIFGTSIPSLRGKLVAEKVYEKPQIKAKNSAANKAEIVSALEILWSAKAGSLKSLENASHACLTKVKDLVIAQSERVNLGE